MAGEGTMVVCLSGRRLFSRSTMASFSLASTLGMFLRSLPFLLFKFTLSTQVLC